MYTFYSWKNCKPGFDQANVVDMNMENNEPKAHNPFLTENQLNEAPMTLI